MEKFSSTKRSKLIEAALLIGMLISIFAQGVCAFAEERQGITEDVFRLHILANSDSDEDQQLKLKVRNAVLEEGAYIFGNNISAEQAAFTATEHLDDFKAVAERVIYENGYDYFVNCEVTNMLFDERVYGSATLPEGDYTALRITIGSAEGHNWWCVMFPPLCLPAVTNTDEVLANAEEDGILTEEEIRIMQNPSNYEVRFYFADIIQKLADYLKSK